MIECIKGRVISVDRFGIILSVNDIIHIKINCNGNAFYKYLDKELLLYTHIRYNETNNEFECFGFIRKEEKELFLKLQKVSGIGPKLAMNIIYSVPLEDLIINIANGNLSYFEQIKGVGKKTAARIVLELKENVKKEFKESDTEFDMKDDLKSEIALALYSLGFTQNDVNCAINSLGDIDNIEDGIKKALRELSKI